VEHVLLEYSKVDYQIQDHLAISEQFSN